ncbi:MAG: endonuclease domain-containing protein [Beijerinckiaceae bacterium]
MSGDGKSIHGTLSPRGRGQGEGITPSASQALDLTPLARGLRHNATDAEKLLWSRLRGRRMAGWKFKRQVPIGPYIADFVCSDAWLIIELDGGHHNRGDVEIKDRQRSMELEGRGYLVARFWNNEVHENLDGVCDTILNLAQGAVSHV